MYISLLYNIWSQSVSRKNEHNVMDAPCLHLNTHKHWSLVFILPTKEWMIHKWVKTVKTCTLNTTSQNAYHSHILCIVLPCEYFYWQLKSTKGRKESLCWLVCSVGKLYLILLLVFLTLFIIGDKQPHYENALTFTL